MRTLLAFCTVLFVGCGTDYDPVCRPYLPDSKRDSAMQQIKSVMATLAVESRGENEDWDDFLEQAEETVMRIYGEQKWGVRIWDKQGSYERGFIPYEECTEEQKRMIDKYKNGK